MFISEMDVYKINALLGMVNDTRRLGQKCSISNNLQDGTEFKIYHMGKENKTIRIDFKVKEE